MFERENKLREVVRAEILSPKELRRRTFSLIDVLSKENEQKEGTETRFFRREKFSELYISERMGIELKLQRLYFIKLSFWPNRAQNVILYTPAFEFVYICVCNFNNYC